jgi:hypothetical protein
MLSTDGLHHIEGKTFPIVQLFRSFSGQTNIQTDRQPDLQTNRQADKQTDRQTEIDRLRDREIERGIER